ncbi:MAG: cation-transporting P-type ATPase [Deltaproteobacteria bacterium]|nr:cation-transporting P-type ATPase [Deltaproteobacteria bacterium]
MKSREPALGENRDASQPWAFGVEELLQNLSVSADQGLDSTEAGSRLNRYGPNRLHAARERSVWSILFDQFKNLIILLLGAAAALSFAFERWLEGVSILIAVVLNAGIGFFTEWRAVRSMEALENLGRTRIRTLRDGRTRDIDSENLVPGDIVFVEAGDLVPADTRLVDASGLRVDESSLTGESEGVPKQTGPIDPKAALSERFNMLYRGTAVTGGSGKGLVVATGMETELGRIAAMAENAGEEETPLEKRLDRLGRRLVWVTLAVTAVVALSGILVGKDLLLIIETAIALAVAAIPEGLPIVATIALARGMWRMAGRNALINRLSAVETLGSTTVICTDKTGTLTENRLTLRRVALPGSGSEPVREVSLVEGGTGQVPADDELLRGLMETGALCIQAVQHAGSRKGDPLEKALVSGARSVGVERADLTASMPLEREIPFDRSVRMMAVYNTLEDGRYRVSVKGAPEAVLEVCSRIRTPEGTMEMDPEVRRRWNEENNDLAGEDGLRVLAGAVKEVEDADAEPYKDLVFQGLYGLMDPPRAGVRESVEACRHAGIRVIMVTGDQPMTARSIALALGMVGEKDVQVIRGEEIGKEGDKTANRDRVLRAPVFARVSPRQKLDLVTIHQEAGEVVAMTGDGVNDAPALKKADIGIAMGKRGTQVARQAADMVLKDDAFYSIVAAVEQGRAIFDNIRKFIVYLLSGNVSEIMIVTAALLAGAPLPLLPLQILYLNLIGDVFPALALGLGGGDPSLMDRPPRDPKEPVLARRHWIYIVASSVVLAAAVLGGFALAFHWLRADRSTAVTISFLTLAFARLWHVFNMREKGTHVLRNDVVRNPFVWGALGLCSLLLLAGVYAPGLSLVLGLEAPDVRAWGLILGMSLMPLVLLQIQKGRSAAP